MEKKLANKDIKAAMTNGKGGKTLISPVVKLDYELGDLKRGSPS